MRGPVVGTRYRSFESTLTGIGAGILHKRLMHEKLVFVDGKILWVGSLNVLSQSGSQETMERRTAKDIVSLYADAMGMDSLVSSITPDAPACPACDGELVVATGMAGPYYWRCLDDECQYTRSHDQPSPVDGRLTCPTCGGVLEFGEWGTRPAWRCVDNRRHHVVVRRAHLRLPAMKALIPKGKLRKVERDLGLESASSRAR